MLNENALAITILCSHLCLGRGVKALEPNEWSNLALRLVSTDLEPRDLLDLTNADLSQKLQLHSLQVEKLRTLLNRAPSLSFELEKYTNMGINIITRADEAYPHNLKKKLKNNCPPLFYYAGDLALLQQPAVGYVGSRTLSREDLLVEEGFVEQTVKRGYAVVSGGARGADTTAEETALRLGGQAVAFLADSLMRKFKKVATVQAIHEGRLLYLSAANPTAGFNVGMAMSRNKYIYAHSLATVAIRSDYNKGGTWAGATECLANSYCPCFCWDNPDYEGNQALIKRGALPLPTNWDGNIEPLQPPPAEPSSQAEVEQLVLFG